MDENLTKQPEKQEQPEPQPDVKPAADTSPPPATPTEEKPPVDVEIEPKKFSKTLLILILILVISAMGVGGLYLWKQNQLDSKTPPEVSQPTTIPTPTLTPEEQELVNLGLDQDNLDKEFEEIETDVEQL